MRKLQNVGQYFKIAIIFLTSAVKSNIRLLAESPGLDIFSSPK